MTVLGHFSAERPTNADNSRAWACYAFNRCGSGCFDFFLAYHISFSFLLSLRNGLTDRWIDDLQIYVLFNSISVISGQWAYDNIKLCNRAPFRIEKSGPERSLGQRRQFDKK